MPRGIPRQAKDNVFMASGHADTAEMEVPQGESRVLKSTGPASKALDENIIQIVGERVMDSEKMQMMAFMNEPVTVRVATTGDKQAEQIFELTIHGKTEVFKRGETKTVPRNFAALLLRLKTTNYVQREVMSADGARQYVHDPVTALKYDFSMVRDDNPLGKSWMESLLREPG